MACLVSPSNGRHSRPYVEAMTARTLAITVLFGAAATIAAAAAVPVPTTRPAADASPSAPAAPVELTKQQLDFFETKVRPVLADRCYKCHSIEAGKNKGGLVLDSRDGWLKGGENGPEIVPGDPGKSRLIKAIGYTDPDLQMPPKGEKLAAKEVAALTEWVKMGAPDPRTAPAGGKLTGLNDKARSHWAFQPVTRPAVPEVQNKAWVRTSVDAFILAKLEQNGMRPSPPASKEALIRRATYDLIGLPPTPEEVRAFVNDRSADAFEKVVDRLLASPHYGERWGRFWLDSARYSDTSGIENARKDDYRYAYAWTYRDYVIQAFNDDKPYDQFLREQLAADQLPDADQHPDRLAALGFLTVGKRFQNPNDQIDERIDTIGKSMLAMTVACARCHDHKFDPIPQADYYSLHGILAGTVEPAERPLVGKAPSGPDYEDFKRKLEALEAKNREIYYDLIATKSAEFRKNAGTYLLVSLLQRKNNKDDLTERNRLISENKLDRDLYQGGLKINGRQDPILTPLFRFAQLPKDEFDNGARAILREISAGGNRRFTVNPLVAKAFKELPPDAVHGLKDVTDVYGKLFASIDEQAKAYLEARRHAKGKEVSGFDRDMVELFDVPAKIEPAGALDTDTLRALAPRLPVVNQGAYGKFTFAQINELELTH